MARIFNFLHPQQATNKAVTYREYQLHIEQTQNQLPQYFKHSRHVPFLSI